MACPASTGIEMNTCLVHGVSARSLKLRADFVAIVSRYTKPRRVGRQFVALCPFHCESDPSLYIEPRRKIWHCFGCERGGDVFSFVMLAEDCDFPTALRIVAGVDEASEPQGSRLGRGEGAQPLARAAGTEHSQNSRAAILARLAETEQRNAVIRAADDSAFAEFATACEPERGFSLLLVNKRITGLIANEITITHTVKTNENATEKASLILAVSDGSR